ncbi:hypothetical protein N9395_09370 [Pseudomonadales bacterium]|nr:hypothetical protein [Pseudomonadales bacterium]
MELQRSASGLVKSLVGIALVISFGFASIDEVMAEDDKKKTRRVPAISQSLYKQMSEAQVMIDPERVSLRQSQRVRLKMVFRCSWT